MRDYELMVVLDSNLDDAQTEALTGRITTLVGQRGGSVLGTDAWGKRRLAYPIGRHRDATYILLRLSIAPGVAAEIERMLKLSESVLRHLLVRADETASAPAPAHA